jgi:phage tail sheath protein FI
VQLPQTPGVYYERVDVSAPGISALRTDIAGFVGIASRGPLHQALPVQSFRQFQAYFGDFTGAGFLAYAVRGFFENGGQRCWIIRVASELAAAAEATVGSGTQDIWKISASSPGVWGNDLEIGVRETHRAQTLSEPKGGSIEFSEVATITGFSRGVHVRLSQGTTTAYKVVSAVDAVLNRLIWLNPDPGARLPYDSVLIGFDLDQPILIESIEYTLSVWERGTLIRTYEGLSLIPESPSSGPQVLPPLVLPEFSREFLTLPPSPEPLVIEEIRSLPILDLSPLATAPNSPIPLSSGADGMSTLSKYEFVGESVDPHDSDLVKARKIRGIRALEQIGEVSIIAVPDINIQPRLVPRYNPPPPCIPDPCLPSGPPAAAVPQPPSVEDLPPVFSDAEIFQVQSEMIDQCETLRDRIALIDPPLSAARDDKAGVGAVRAWRARFDSKYAAFYYPWLRVVDPLRSAVSITRDIPPSGHVAGQYARSDFRFGVHKAPANSPMVWVEDVTVAVNDQVHGVLNPVGINAIRALPGRNIRIFGARTVSSDPDWRFVNVRRLLMMIEKAIDVSIQWATFEPNNVSTRTKIQLVLTSFLISLWQRGALMGAAAEEAFFVKCDEENNPPAERANGRMLATVGVAPSQPFEFVILRVGRAQNQFEISEVPAGASAAGVF